MSGTGTSSDPSAEGSVHMALESPVLIHVWEVDPAQHGVAVRHLREMLGEIVSEPGFVSARVLQSADRTSIAVVVEMRTVEDRQRLRQLAPVRQALDHLRGTINVVISLYDRVATYHA